jgi:hypothetical protein
VIKSRRMGWAGHDAVWRRGKACTGFWWGKPDGKSPLERPKRRWENNIKIDLRKWDVEA